MVAAAEVASESVTSLESKNAWNSTVLDWRRDPALRIKRRQLRKVRIVPLEAFCPGVDRKREVRVLAIVGIREIDTDVCHERNERKAWCMPTHPNMNTKFTILAANNAITPCQQVCGERTTASIYSVEPLENLQQDIPSEAETLTGRHRGE